jgi:mannitol/fructose-specific phosphotransferase system IIA component (Ntr-type)
LSQKAVEYLRPATFTPGLKASSLLDAIEQMLTVAQKNPDVLDPAALRAAVLDRQKINPPVLPSGIALPHARTDSVRSMVIVVATTDAPLPVESLAVQVMFLIGVPKTATVQYLELISFLTRHLRDPGTVERLCRAADKDEFLGVFLEK